MFNLAAKLAKKGVITYLKMKNLTNITHSLSSIDKFFECRDDDASSMEVDESLFLQVVECP